MPAEDQVIEKLLEFAKTDRRLHDELRAAVLSGDLQKTFACASAVVHLLPEEKSPHAESTQLVPRIH